MGERLPAGSASVVEAVDCAVEIQRAMRRRAEDVALTGRIVPAERHDRSADDLLALQDSLVGSLATRLSHDPDRMCERPRFTTGPEAYPLRAQADHESRIDNPDSCGSAVAPERRLRVAIRLDPFHDWLPDRLPGEALLIRERLGGPPE